MHASLALLALSFVLTKAEVAPAGSSIILQGLNDFCLLDQILANVSIGACSSTNHGAISWVVQKGGVASGTGPAGQIIFPNNNNNCLTVNGNVADGTKLITATCNPANPLQQWNVNGDQTITLANSNFCVDLTNGDTSAGNLVQIWTCFAGNSNQQWIPRPVPPGLGPNGLEPGSTDVNFLLPEPIVHEDGCLAASSNADGASVILSACAFDASEARVSQNWTLTAGSSSTGQGPAGTITVFGGTKCLDLTNGVSTNGNKLQIWTCTPGNSNQQWQVNSDASISWAGGNKCVDNTNGNTTNGNPAQIWDCFSGSPNQGWAPQQNFG